MRFGGHESFAVREGWLARGLELLSEAPEQLTHQYSEDYLGVGRNMAKSIRHWLHATGLSEGSGSPIDPLKPTALGELVRRYDPHFLDLGTWWMLHINLVLRPQQAYSWTWFFNQWAIPRFERGPCIESLKRYAAVNLGRSPSPKTVERDVATLLQSYARSVPPRRDDPEDSSDSPFQDLGLLSHFPSTGAYRLNFGPKAVPSTIFGYALAAQREVAAREDLSISELERGVSSPGRLFLLRGDDIYDLLTSYESQDAGRFAVRSQAGERGLRLGRIASPEEWASIHYRESEVPQHV